MATAVAAARHIFVSESRFNQLARTGVYDRAKMRGGGFDLDVIREISFKQLRDELHRRGDQAGGLTEERTRRAHAEANIATRKDQAAAGKLVEVDALVKLVSAEHAVTNEKLLSMAGELHGELGPEHAALVDGKAREILLELSDPNSLVRRAARVAVGLGAVHDAAVAIREKKENEDEDEDEDEDE